MKIAVLGPAGTHGERTARVVAEKRDSAHDPVFRQTEKRIAQTVGEEARQAEFGLIAYYNSSAGLVSASLDAIFLNNLHIVGAQRAVVHHSLGKRQDGSGGIHSHIMALYQCEDYLAEHFPDHSIHPALSTAAAAELVGTQGGGMAIAHAETLTEYGLTIVKRDFLTTQTDFLLVSKTPRSPIGKGPYRSIIALTPLNDESGLLHKVTGIISGDFCFNMTDVHSRPSLIGVEPVNGNQPKMFYIELDAHQQEGNFRHCVRDLGLLLRNENVRILGTYERPDLT